MRERIGSGRFLSVVLLVTALFAGALNAAVHKEISYKSEPGSDYELTRCKLDLHVPDGVKKYPTIVWFHGGSIKSGDKAGDIALGLAKRLNSHGIAVASVNYRLSPTVSFPAYVNDAATAVAWVLAHISDYGGSTDAVFVSGHSAGGYLAAMVGMDQKYLGHHNMSPNDLAGFIPVAGQMVTHSTVREERGIPPTRPVIDAAAPSFHVHSNAPPFLCIVADADLPARAEENTYFVAAMRAVGNTEVEFVQIPDRDHGSVAAMIKNENDPALLQILSFIKSHKD